MIQLKVKNYHEYLEGSEVEATVNTKNREVYLGAHVLVFKDSVAATSNVSVPQDKLTSSIGVEGIVTQVLTPENAVSDSITQKLKIKKI